MRPVPGKGRVRCTSCAVLHSAYSSLSPSRPSSQPGCCPRRPPRSAPRRAGGRTLTVGSVTLNRCNDVLAGAYCGRVVRQWDPTGAVPPGRGPGRLRLPAGEGHGQPRGGDAAAPRRRPGLQHDRHRHRLRADARPAAQIATCCWSISGAPA